MAAEFGDRIDELLARVGAGDITGSVEVDQLYAAIQHNSLDYKHPRGGQALYLHEPLMNQRDKYIGEYARRLLEDGGKRAIVDAMEDLAETGGVAVHAPVEYGDLRASGHPKVDDDGVTMYDREPRQRRLTVDELKAKYREHHPDPSRFTPGQLRWLWSHNWHGKGP